MKKIFLINGPNLNMLGHREVDIYGKESLDNIVEKLKKKSNSHGVTISAFQSNHEGAIIDFIQNIFLKKKIIKILGIIINSASFTHTSIGIRDALTFVEIPFIEVHISNIYSREKFRHQSFLSEHAKGIIAGLGSYGYEAALNFFLQTK